MNLTQYRDVCNDNLVPTPPDLFTLSKTSDEPLPPGVRAY
jgi:hypothetical protein